jgi:hypothetical protein
MPCNFQCTDNVPVMLHIWHDNLPLKNASKHFQISEQYVRFKIIMIVTDDYHLAECDGTYLVVTYCIYQITWHHIQEFSNLQWTTNLQFWSSNEYINTLFTDIWYNHGGTGFCCTHRFQLTSNVFAHQNSYMFIGMTRVLKNEYKVQAR